jgi:membrane fusion protein (multidrug efflux system)
MAEIVVMPKKPEEQDRTQPQPEKPAEKESKKEQAKSFFRERPMAKWILLGAVVVLLAGGVYFWHYYSVRESTDDAQIEGDIVPIAARVGGTVSRVLVDDNQYVKAGTVLVEIDPTDYQVALDRAQAELADAEATSRAAKTGVPLASTTTSSQLDVTKANRAAAGKQVDAANARLREAEANYRKAAADLARFKPLVEKDEISHQQFDAAVAAEEAAKASVESAKASVATAQSQERQAAAQVAAASTVPEQVNISRAKASASEAQVKKNEAALAQAKLNIQYTTVKAPTDGIVSRKSVQPGQIVQPGQPLLAIVPLENVWVVANFKESQLKDMHVGQPATIHVDAYDHDYKGHVDSIGGATSAKFSLLPPENATGNYVKVVQRVPVKLVFEKDQDREHKLRPGMSVVPTVFVK